ncbi:leucyl aminopeptidase [Actibacterium pelagium]|uniref:Probable cytosol aminopeptidase n=1 Tax=Actibacterium pelagium TaxID=2029103 RepID=A0A917AEB9_9RHOB|nr:leucyl aminopeptidase [Actibacterium pelagium]GGE44701.1 putative cytosol aminopeptidase [Actibacterium pelagium]
MTTPPSISIVELDLDAIASATGRVALFINAEGKMDPAARRVNKLSKGGVQRALGSKAFEKLKSGGVISLTFPPQMEAKAIDIVKLERRPSVSEARKAGAALAQLRGEDDVLLLAGSAPKAAEIGLGFALRAYDFTDHKTADAPVTGTVTLAVTKPDDIADDAAVGAAIAEGVFFTRDLVNEPANVLTTQNFADRLVAMKDIGLKVEVLEEAELEKLGMGALLGVGQGSESPSKVVVMQWNGGGDEAPFALVGKGVVFDTGGISLKPAGGMEDMTMDMGGAGTVAGVMRAIALRKAKANVVGLVGLVENMPDALAQRPGDVVTSMKGDTIEVINTDAEGRLVLADVLWYTQERFKPSGIIDLATLTGAIIIGLGHENAGVFSNDDDLSKAFLKAAETEEEGAWRMPMGQAYDDKLKSRIADMMNVGGRDAGSITAAQFLKRFVKDETPWIHLDIAGVASVKTPTTFAPKGATGWGVRALDRLIRDKFEV